MKRKIIRRILTVIATIGLIGWYVFSTYLQGATYTKVTVVKDKGESCIFGYRRATVINAKGDSSVVLVDEKMMFNNKVPFKATVKKSQRFDEVFGIISTYIWEKSFWKKSFNVIVIKETWSPYVDEVKLTAITKSGIEITCSMNKTLFQNKKIPFSAKVINKVDGSIGYGFVIEK